MHASPPRPEVDRSGLSAYGRGLRSSLSTKRLAPVAPLALGELVLLLSDSDGEQTRTVVRMHERRVEVLDEAASVPVPRAVVRCALTDWQEFLCSGRLDDESVDVFGDVSVVETFLRVYALDQSPLNLRCAMMSRSNGQSSRTRH